MNKNLSDSRFAKSIKMSGPGYKSMLVNQTCTIETLELICKIYDVSINYFFDDLKKGSIYKSNEDCRECLKKDAKIELLEEQLKDKEIKIDALNRELGKSDQHKRTG